jgi:FdhD protein
MTNAASGAERLEILRVRERSAAPGDDWVVVEEPLEIRVRGQSVAVTMRTPGHDAELACGFLVSEGILTRRDDLLEVAPCLQAGASRSNILNVFLRPEATLDLARLTRHTFASSSCGLCGKATIDSVHQHFPPVEDDFAVSPEIIVRLPDKLREAQATFDRTGGVHAAGLFTDTGELLVLREDVGRHNAVDKVIGWAFLQKRLPLRATVLLVSGRASFEIVQKALAARIPMIAAVSAPSNLAVEFARESGQTLVGFLRGASFNVYTCPARLQLK